MLLHLLDVLLSTSWWLRRTVQLRSDISFSVGTLTPFASVRQPDFGWLAVGRRVVIRYSRAEPTKESLKNVSGMVARIDHIWTF